jgi:hypothetical protein
MVSIKFQQLHFSEIEGTRDNESCRWVKGKNFLEPTIPLLSGLVLLKYSGNIGLMHMALFQTLHLVIAIRMNWNLNSVCGYQQF